MSVPWPPSMVRNASKSSGPLPKPLMEIVSAPSPELIVSDDVGLAKVTLSAFVDVTVVIPAVPESDTVMTSSAMP